MKQLPRFGLLTVLGIDPNNRRYRLCRCDCGTEKLVRIDHLNSGKTISCGCESLRRASKRAHVMHSANVTHGASKTPAYSVWAHMRGRCQNPNNRAYQYYGARGITVCERWETFENFLADMGHPSPNQEIERIDNDQGYSPDNCRWASKREQQNNRRTNRLITYEGRTQTIAQWAREIGKPFNVVRKRLISGWPLSEVLSSDSFAGRLPEKTHCRRGHPFDAENTRIDPRTGQRFCRACHRDRERARRK
jgi:hypothetical protein